jgi:hypothetical protein
MTRKDGLTCTVHSSPVCQTVLPWEAGRAYMSASRRNARSELAVVHKIWLEARVDL